MNLVGEGGRGFYLFVREDIRYAFLFPRLGGLECLYPLGFCVEVRKGE